MKSFIFISTEGHTYQPNSVSTEPDIENCQVLGYGDGENSREAFKNLIENNNYLMATAFDEIICLQLASVVRHK